MSFIILNTYLVEMTIFGLFSLSIGVVGLLFLIYKSVKKNQSKSWVPTQGTVIDYCTKSKRSLEYDLHGVIIDYWPEITYSYEYLDQEYVSTRYSYLDTMVCDINDIPQETRDLYKGQHLVVFVNPKNPLESVVKKAKGFFEVFDFIHIAVLLFILFLAVKLTRIG